MQGQCGCVGGFCLGTLWVCQGSLSGVSVDPSRSLCGVTGGPVLDQCGYVRGPCLGSVWVSVGSLHGGPSIAVLSAPHGRRRARDAPRLVPCCSVRVPSVSFLQTGTLVPAPPNQCSLLGTSERAWQQEGSGSTLCAPLCELWRPLDGPGHSPSPQTLAEPPPLCPPWRICAEAGLVSKEKTQHKQARVLCPHSPCLGPTFGGPDRHGGGAIPAGSWIGDPSRSRSLHHRSDCDIEPQIVLGDSFCLPTFPCGWAPGRKAGVTHSRQVTSHPLGDTSCLLFSSLSGLWDE